MMDNDGYTKNVYACAYLINVLISFPLVHGFNCFEYIVNEGSQLTTTFHSNVKGRTGFQLINLTGKINSVS